MNFTIRILLPADKEAIMAFARTRMAANIAEPMEREMHSWSARWRAEALDHYLPMGWSFAAFAGDELRGFFLGQPLLFYRGLTQTLWLEHCECSDNETIRQLLDTAYRWARDKHFQCVLIEGSSQLVQALEGWAPARTTELPLIEIKSARY